MELSQATSIVRGMIDETRAALQKLPATRRQLGPQVFRMPIDGQTGRMIAQPIIEAAGVENYDSPTQDEKTNLGLVREVIDAYTRWLETRGSKAKEAETRQADTQGMKEELFRLIRQSTLTPVENEKNWYKMSVDGKEIGEFNLWASGGLYWATFYSDALKQVSQDEDFKAFVDKLKAAQSGDIQFFSRKEDEPFKVELAAVFTEKLG